MATPTHQKQTKEMLMNMEISTMMHMPDEIIGEILPWLPAKSLLRFRWVCKYWFDLIRESSFVKKHLFRSNNNCSSRLWGSDYSKFSMAKSFTKCYIDYTTGVFSRKVTTVAYPFTRSHSLPRIFGPCHGLILCACSSIAYTATLDTKLCILNPCTKEYKEIPSAPPVLDQGFYAYPYYEFSYGFGYDRTTDDYKVIRVAYNWSPHGNNENIGSFLHVYTLGTNSWRGIGFIPYTILPYPHTTASCVSVNGALYWRNYSKTKIVSFDIGKESYEEITNQPVCFHDNLKNGKLGIFEGSLSVILRIDDPITGMNYVEMWVMKDNYYVNNTDNESSWTKLFRTKPSLACSFMYLKPLRFIKSGEIVLMNTWGSLLSYDPKTPTTLMALKRTWGKEEHCTNVVENENIVYIESLVSLNSGTYAVEKQKELTERKIESMHQVEK